MKKILVTGGAGFIGANMVPMLVEKGYEVTIFDNMSRGNLLHLDDPEKYKIIEADIRDEENLLDSLAGIDAVVHLAAYGSVVESVQSPDENFEINVRGTFNVLKAAQKNKVNKLVFASTGGALIGNATPPVNESSVPRPISPYGASKLAGEGYCCAFANSYGMDIVALRFANVIGPISWHKKGAVTAFMKAIMNGDPITIYGDGSATRDFLYVDDLCNGIIKGLESQLNGFNAFHLAAGREVSVKELAEEICRVSGKTSQTINFLDKRAGEVERNFANYDLAQEVLGFKPRYSLEEGLEKTWQWFVEKNNESNN